MDHSPALDLPGARRSAVVLTVLSFAAWAAGTAILAFAFWQDAQKPPVGARDDVGAGLAGLAFLVLVGLFVLATAIGAVLGTLAVRRAAGYSPALLAQGLNVVTLLGVILSMIVNLVFL